MIEFSLLNSFCQSLLGKKFYDVSMKRKKFHSWGGEWLEK